jgi:hypothetical protein
MTRTPTGPRIRTLLVACLTLVVPVVAGCVPKAHALPGVPTPAAIPALELPAGHTRFVFDWTYEDTDIHASGDGAIRAAYPDSARLDLFVGGGMGGATAMLVGNDLRAPGPNAIRRVIPPAPLLWAALGRLSVPPAADTAARLDGDTLRVDIGRGSVWRVTIASGALRRLERIEDGHIVQSVIRADDRHVRYFDAAARRSLELVITAVDRNVDFDASIWSF